MRPALPTRVYVDLPVGLDPKAWRARHERDEVPDLLPYGLHRMARYGAEVVLRPARRNPALSRVSRSVRHRTGGAELLEELADRPHTRFVDPDAVLCYDERTGVPAALLAGRRGRHRRPVVTGIGWLTTRDQAHPVMRRLARRALPRAAIVWTQNRPVLPLLSSEWGVDPERVRFLPFGIDTDFYTVQPPPQRPNVVASAGEDRYRDHDLLVGAIEDISRHRPDVHLELATALPVDLPPERGTLYTERMDGRMRELYARCSVVAVALEHTIAGSGLSVVLEAMASGRPIVVTGNPGLEDYVDDGVTGILVPPNDRAAFAAAIESLLVDPDRAQAMGRAGADAVRARFTSDAMAHALAAMVIEAAGHA